MVLRTTAPCLKRAVAAGLASALSVLLVVAPAAAGAPTVSIPPGNPGSYKTIVVSGSGFPGHYKIPTGLQIYECADPGGSVDDLPTSAAGCDGTTISSVQINTDLHGNFSTKYTPFIVTVKGTGSNINCDPTHFCILWVGVDFNGAFLSGPHAFSRPFRLGAKSPPSSTTTGGSTNPLVIVLPIVGVVVIAAAGLAYRRRRTRPAVGDSAH